MSAQDDLPPASLGDVPQSPAPTATPLAGERLAAAIRDAALELGFARVGFCPVEPFTVAGRALDDWLAKGRHGEMTYLAGEPRADPAALLPQARSLIVVALPYGRDAPVPTATDQLLPLSGLVARYARGDDYHNVLKTRLWRLADRCAELAGRPILARPCVDTAPLLEREAARRAGLGFTAKSTMTIVPGLGSYVLLGELLTDLELSAPAPIAAGCGTCTACLDACPTAAFVDAYTLDARRCISYLTIELRGSIPRELRPLIGRWVFGCDICQEVCPYNQSRRTPAIDPRLRARAELTNPDLEALLQLTASGYRRFVKRSALRRVHRPVLQRNAAVALGNAGQAASIPALRRSLAENTSPLVREHVAWALGRLGTPTARQVLEEHREQETAQVVLEEINMSLSQ